MTSRAACEPRRRGYKSRARKTHLTGSVARYGAACLTQFGQYSALSWNWPPWPLSAKVPSQRTCFLGSFDRRITTEGRMELFKNYLLASRAVGWQFPLVVTCYTRQYSETERFGGKDARQVNF
jgi:hypothetical protein